MKKSLVIFLLTLLSCVPDDEIRSTRILGKWLTVAKEDLTGEPIPLNTCESLIVLDFRVQNEVVPEWSRSTIPAVCENIEFISQTYRYEGLGKWLIVDGNIILSEFELVDGKLRETLQGGNEIIIYEEL